MKRSKSKPRPALHTMRGTIVAAGHVEDFISHGKHDQSAMLHIQEDAGNPASAQVAVKVHGDMVNYVGCIGARVVVEYVVRVFDCKKKGIPTLGNDIYATSIQFAR